MVARMNEIFNAEDPTRDITGKVIMTIELDLDLPGIDFNSTEELTEWVLKERQSELKQAAKFKRFMEGPSDLQQATHKLDLLDKISVAQRMCIQKEEPKIVWGDLLSGLLDLMKSEYGFIGEIKYEPDGTMFLQTHAVTNIAWNAATMAFYEENADSGLKFYNLNTLFGNVMTSKKPVLSNDPKNDTPGNGIPEGHPPLNAFLGMPFFLPGENTMIGMVGIANKPGGYSEYDISLLEPFLNTCSIILVAYNAIRERETLICNLEEIVKERTSELELANVNLEMANRQIVEASAAQLQHFACMSHEIRTPLNCVIGMSSLLIQEGKFDSVEKESMKMIVTSGELLLQVVNDVLDYSKLASGKTEIESKETVLQNTLDAVVHSIEVGTREKDITFKTAYGNGVPDKIVVDSRRLQQILYNLLGNAVKFSGACGVIEFSVDIVDGDGNEVGPIQIPSGFHHADLSQTHTDEAKSRCPFLRSNEKKLAPTYLLRFKVKDYGIGVDVADLDRIFKPFLQAKGQDAGAHGGTGLGLAITAKLVSALGGSISVDSERGEWTEFSFSLPSSGPAVSSLSGKLSSWTILLLLDDDEQPPASIFEAYKINVKHLHHSEELVSIATSGDLSQAYLCVVQDNLYDDAAYEQLEKVAKTKLVTVGKKQTMESSAAHFRSIKQQLPSGLVRSLSQILEDKPAETADGKESDGSDFSSVRVLIAEDNSVNQKVLTRVLTRLGFSSIDVVDNGEKAVNACKEGEYNLVLMDMLMPVMDGLEACRLIVDQRQDSALPKVVFVTANASYGFEEQAEGAGSDGFITKPFNMQRLEEFFRAFAFE